MIKPTPTPLPPGTPFFSVPNSYSLWASTDTVIQYWRMSGAAGTIFQVIILIAIVIVGVKVIMHWVDRFTEWDSKS